MAASLFPSVASLLPPGIAVDGDRIRIDIRRLLADRHLEELAGLRDRSARQHSAGAVVLDVRARGLVRGYNDSPENGPYGPLVAQASGLLHGPSSFKELVMRRFAWSACLVRFDRRGDYRVAVAPVVDAVAVGGCARDADVQQGRPADSPDQLPGVSPARRDRADVAGHLRRSASIRSSDGEGGHQQDDAAVVRGSDGRALQERQVLSDADIATIASWAEKGALEGDAKDKPAPVEFGDGWTIGKPDLVVTMPKDVEIPATGVIDQS